MTVQVDNDRTFPHRSVVFISGFFSQREGVLGRYAPLLVTVHLRMPLTQTTVDTMSVFEASRVAPKSEWVAMLKNRTDQSQKVRNSTKESCDRNNFVVERGCEYDKFWKEDKFELRIKLMRINFAAAGDRTRDLQIRNVKWQVKGGLLCTWAQSVSCMVAPLARLVAVAIFVATHYFALSQSQYIHQNSRSSA